MRTAMNAIFYLLRTGCPWRHLPRGPFPPRSKVYNIFCTFPREGAWEAIWAELLLASPTAAITDSQSLKSAENGAVKTGVETTQWVTTLQRKSKDASSTPWSIPKPDHRA